MAILPLIIIHYFPLFTISHYPLSHPCRPHEHRTTSSLLLLSPSPNIHKRYQSAQSTTSDHNFCRLMLDRTCVLERWEIMLSKGQARIPVINELLVVAYYIFVFYRIYSPLYFLTLFKIQLTSSPSPKINTLLIRPLLVSSPF